MCMTSSQVSSCLWLMPTQQACHSFLTVIKFMWRNPKVSLGRGKEQRKSTLPQRDSKAGGRNISADLCNQLAS